MQWLRDDFRITDDPAEIVLPVVHTLLADTYWAKTRPVERTEKAIQHSLPFSLFHKANQVGFGRVFTDYAVYAIVSDVVVAPACRGQGLGKWLLATMIAHPDVNDLRLVLTRTSTTPWSHVQAA